MADKKKKRRNKRENKPLVVGLFLLVIWMILWKAPNYELGKIAKQTIRFVYETTDLTKDLEKPVIRDEQGEIYLAIEDIAKIWDEDIYYDVENEQVITSTDKKLATMKKNEAIISINSSKMETYGMLLEENDTLYLPIQDFSGVYNLEIKDIRDTNTVVIDNLEEKYLIANSKKNLGVKYLQDTMSKNVDHVQKGDPLILDTNQDLNSNWLRVRTQNGKVGYVKKGKISNISTLREDMQKEKQIEGTVYLFVDEFASLAQAPNRTGEPLDSKVNAVAPTMLRIQKNEKTNLRSNIGTAGERYVTWAHNQGYKVWPILSNPDMDETTNNLLKDYGTREKLINDLVSAILKYNFDGITVRFEKISDTNGNFVKFVSELSPRLREIGKVLVIDQTKQVNGSRDSIQKVADYILETPYGSSKLIKLD